MLDEYRQEYTVFGSTMYRECALKSAIPDGCRELDLQYDGFAQDGDTLEVRFSTGTIRLLCGFATTGPGL